MNVRKEALTFAYIINLEQKNLHKIYEAAFSETVSSFV